MIYPTSIYASSPPAISLPMHPHLHLSHTYPLPSPSPPPLPHLPTAITLTSTSPTLTHPHLHLSHTYPLPSPSPPPLPHLPTAITLTSTSPTLTHCTHNLLDDTVVHISRQVSRPWLLQHVVSLVLLETLFNVHHFKPTPSPPPKTPPLTLNVCFLISVSP